MADDDDFFSDDAIDDKTWDLIDARVAEERAKRPSSSQLAPPPAKRPRLAQNAPPSRLQSLDDLPDILVTGNGKYGIQDNPRNTPVSNRQPSIAPPRSRPPPPPNRNVHRPIPQSRPTPTPDPPTSLPNSTQDLELKVKLAALQADLERVNAELTSRKDEAYKKSGEVTMLRRKMETEKKQNAAKIAEAQAKVQEVNQKVTQLQRDMKMEREKMQSEMLFQRQDAELARRQQRPPRPQATPARPQVTPARIQTTPITIRNFSQVTVPRTVSPVTSPVAKPRPSQGLRGFQNAFGDTSPLRPRNKAGKQQKEQRLVASSSSPTSQAPSDYGFVDVMMEDNDAAPDVDMDANDPFIDTTPQPGPPLGQEQEYIMEIDYGPPVVDLPALDWKAELHRAILTYKHPTANQTALQELLTVSLPDTLYHTAIGQLLMSVSMISDYQAVATSIASSLVTMASLLFESNNIPASLTITGLLHHLIYSVPNFTNKLLSPTSPISPSKDTSFQPRLLVSLCGFISRNLQHSPSLPVNKPLADAIIDLLCALCWNPGCHDDLRLLCLTQESSTYATLLHFSNPSWLLRRVTDFIALHISSCPQATTPYVTLGNDIKKFPLIERLCAFLLDKDTKYEDEDGLVLQDSVIRCLSLMSVAPDTTISKVPALLPSLSRYLVGISRPLWQDDDDFVSSPERVSATLRRITRTVYLFHHLVVFQEHDYLRRQLHTQPTQHLAGAPQMFIEALSRLVYGWEQEWMSDGVKEEMKAISEIAGQVLDGYINAEAPEDHEIRSVFQEGKAIADDLDDDDRMDENEGWD
ncbi:hypothetical protein CYLTODRAFT_423025 [Cylindrobasidium torrendii FP15055 ss-10]|uniref:DNA repair protein Rad26 n=1 Tax=Cylindrobasidium torrendii FP15055 ss-10 TaxID=1314674 RepID=A0A0D7B9G6_9AGAR|nr:hypothetical protein CYLTODRAFT_423025 [Cylindrobasidium torrendii FP15055 ss-10]